MQRGPWLPLPAPAKCGRGQPKLRRQRRASLAAPTVEPVKGLAHREAVLPECGSAQRQRPETSEACQHLHASILALRRLAPLEAGHGLLQHLAKERHALSNEGRAAIARRPRDVYQQQCRASHPRHSAPSWCDITDLLEQPRQLLVAYCGPGSQTLRKGTACHFLRWVWCRERQLGKHAGAQECLQLIIETAGSNCVCHDGCLRVVGDNAAHATLSSSGIARVDSQVTASFWQQRAVRLGCDSQVSTRSARQRANGTITDGLLHGNTFNNHLGLAVLHRASTQPHLRQVQCAPVRRN
mmetsp:Transcript_65224/g.196874  ORF Transcript_65224/g.196874 Transcript_65224/m.196874 type:complete len:297 (-) Transcript_65224:154-1044(-)